MDRPAVALARPTCTNLYGTDKRKVASSQARLPGSLLEASLARLELPAGWCYRMTDMLHQSMSLAYYLPVGIAVTTQSTINYGCRPFTTIKGTNSFHNMY